MDVVGRADADGEPEGVPVGQMDTLRSGIHEVIKHSTCEIAWTQQEDVAAMVGTYLGCSDGALEGSSEGECDGRSLGPRLGRALGLRLGRSESARLGAELGAPESARLGRSDPARLGTAVGPPVGVPVR